MRSHINLDTLCGDELISCPLPKGVKNVLGSSQGRVTIVAFSGSHPLRGAFWWFSCACGRYFRGTNQNRPNSCGCIKIEIATKRCRERATHGLSSSRLYSRYDGMISRCEKPKTFGYERYGGRGIRVCDEWKKDREAFLQWALSNGYQEGLVLDRIDNSKSYAPENCR
jgi:hypothetical protein